MSLALSVTYEAPMLIDVPGYLITVSGLNSVTGADTVTVVRQDLVTGIQSFVRGLLGFEVVADTAISTDYEYELYASGGWEYVVTVYDSTGAVLATTTTALPNAFSQSRQDLAAEVAQSSVVIASVQNPETSLPVILQDFPEWSIPGRVLGTYPVLGRANPVVLTDVMGGKTGSFVVLLDTDLNSKTDVDSWLSLVTGNDTFLFQPYYSTAGMRNFYFKVTDIAVERLTTVDVYEAIEPVFLYTVSFTEIDRPSTESATVTIVTWQDVLDNNSTWQDVYNDHPDWLDVLNNPTG